MTLKIPFVGVTFRLLWDSIPSHIGARLDSTGPNTLKPENQDHLWVCPPSQNSFCGSDEVGQREYCGLWRRSSQHYTQAVFRYRLDSAPILVRNIQAHLHSSQLIEQSSGRDCPTDRILRTWINWGKRCVPNSSLLRRDVRWWWSWSEMNSETPNSENASAGIKQDYDIWAAQCF